ncbi:MAG: LicD family protein [Erysipelotrichaceae bacterium]|nr:LicD family protein [Erysipelotrichaceae bacterium]
MNEDYIDKLKKVELNILCSFIDCCEKLGLKYFMLGGSMLGAVRHQGFIPWDDDIDVGMLRDDYEIFLAKGQELLPDHYFIQSFHSDPNVLFNFAKVRDSRTTFIESSVKKLDINHGVYIDIFPLDYYPATLNEQKHFDLERRKLGLRIRRSLTLTKENRGSIFQEFTRTLVGSLLYIKYPKTAQAIAAREKLFSSVPKSDLIANYSGAWGKKEIVPVDWYGNGIIVKFEGISVRIPEQYDKWLKQVYGNYMELPPVEKRVSHHYTEVIDLDKSYIEYINR